MSQGQTYSPVVPMLSGEDVAAYATANGLTAEVAAERLLSARETTIAQMEQDPIRFGWIPPIWRVCWALLGMPMVDRVWARRMRSHLGYASPVKSLLVLGGNRSSKTQFLLFTTMSLMFKFPRQRFWLFHSTHSMSVENHHRPMYDLLPLELRTEKSVRTRRQYIAYTQQMGFSSSRFVLDEKQECSFRNYCQDRTDAIEGGEVKLAGADELIPVDWYERLETRVWTQAGWTIVGQTPVDGFSQLVRMFCEGATTVKDCTAFLLPKDGGPALEHAALGLSEAEFAEIEECGRRQEQYRTIRSRPQDCDAWLEGRTGEPEAPAGRTFERLPRILRCGNERRAVVHFYSSDNPFGNPPEIVAGLRGKSAAFVRLTWHGLAERTVNVKFPTFSRKVHVVKASAIPREGTNWMIVDPCSGRNMFMGWFRSVPGATYMYREWPGNYHIPRIGVPEPWAVFSTDARRMDGARGGGQKTFGWGMLDYKREIARLERWSAFEQTEPASAELRRGEDGKPEQGVKEWDQDGAAGERIAARYMDARFANVKSFDEGGMRTLIEAFEDIGLTFLDTSQNATGAWTIDEGCALVNDALAYDASRPLDLNNQPKFFISEECVNTIFAMETWTGHDGTDGATKDPCDVVRYLFMKGCEYEEPVTAEMVRAGRGGGCY